MTQEMKEIITSNNKHIVVQSRAGTGKSSTIKEYIKAHPNEKILYLIFSAEMKREAEKSYAGLKNVEIRTIHSLCYRHWVNKNKYTRYNGMSNIEIMKQLRDVSMLEIKRLFSNEELDYSFIGGIYFYYCAFLCSDKKTPLDLQPNSEDERCYLPYVKKLYDYHKDNYVPVPHNFYLKDYIETTDCKLNGFDTICLDEAQDINGASLKIITSNLDKKIIAVGDSAQSIYGFMFCKDSLRILKEDYGFKEYKLTQSFRISDKVAGMCSKLLNWFYEEDMSFTGSNETKVVKIDLENIDKQVVILSRTRLGALLEVLRILDIRKDAKFYYYGGLDKYDMNKVEEMLKYNGVLFIDGQKFHINTLRKLVKEGLDDPTIKGVISRYDFIKKHKNCLELIKSSETKNINEADFCLNTLHGSKGSTYEIVKFAEDIGGVHQLKDRYQKAKDSGVEYLKTEVENSLNLLYVGMSRSTKFLDIGECFVKEDKLATGSELNEMLKQEKRKESV